MRREAWGVAIPSGTTHASPDAGDGPHPTFNVNEAIQMSHRATGTFDVKLVPLAAHHGGEIPPVGRMSIDKVFHGDLEGTSEGEMLAAMTAVKNSAAYVALERVTGTLGGQKGSFVLQHTGLMNRGAGTLTVTIVPDSGTDELLGLSGTMEIIVEGKEHAYVLEYAL